MNISVEKFFQKSANEFFEFRQLVINAGLHRKTIQCELLENNTVDINLVEPLDQVEIKGRNSTPYMETADGPFENLFAPLAVYYSEINLPSEYIYVFPKYSWSIANFFVRNLSFLFLIKSKDIRFKNTAAPLSKNAILISKKMLKMLHYEYEKSMLQLDPEAEKGKYAYYNMINSQFVSGEIFDVQLLDLEHKDLAIKNLQVYEAKFLSKMASELLVIRQEYQKIKFPK